eukprot:760423-Hanusia_phi.AAC.1
MRVRMLVVAQTLMLTRRPTTMTRAMHVARSLPFAQQGRSSFLGLHRAQAGRPSHSTINSRKQGWSRAGLMGAAGGVIGGFVLDRQSPSVSMSMSMSMRGGGEGEGGASSSHRIGAENLLPGGMTTREHLFLLPLRHNKPNGEQLEVFVRELVLSKNKDRADLPSLVFLQGGPGFQAGRPVTSESGWVKRALEEYRVFLLDQRGTGRSSPITHETLAMIKDPAEQAEYGSSDVSGEREVTKLQFH